MRASLHGADEALAGRAELVASTAGAKHIVIERCIVGGYERRMIKPGSEGRPQFGEARSLSYVVPAQAVQRSEREAPAGRANQVALG